MHLLSAQPGSVSDATQAVDLGQAPGDIVFLSAADSELACLAAARDRLGDGFPTLRLASLLYLGHNLSVDLYVERVIAEARLVIVRLLGGRHYWPYGVEQITACCRARGTALAWLPGDDQPDSELTRLSTLPQEVVHRLWQYTVHGGIGNATHLLSYAASQLGHDAEWQAPTPLPRASLYWPDLERPSLSDVKAVWREGAGVAAIIFYRALLQAANLGTIDALIRGLQAEGLNPLPIAVSALRDPVASAVAGEILDEAAPDVVLNGTAFALAMPGGAPEETPLTGPDCPVLQVILSGSSEEAWRTGSAGLSARDIAMNVALPEVDGRIITRAVSFKAEAYYHEPTQSRVVTYQPVPDRVAFVAQLAAAWVRLRRTAPEARRIAMVLANYPSRDGRLANGVGLDTPESVMTVLQRLAKVGYRVARVPQDAKALMAQLTAGVTNDFRELKARRTTEALALDAYQAFFAELADEVRQKVTARWGAPEDDPFVVNDAFRLPVHRFGNVILAIQPARGYNIDPVQDYHSPDLPPPHNYLAFYAWLRGCGQDSGFDAHAVVHVGKHGNLEWLPGKSLALSGACFPEAVFGPLPHVYPFIVNDPGEGAQAKRRGAAVIVDHLTPPLTRAESYGPLRELEMRVDEYYEAAGVDPRRVRVLREQILDLSVTLGLDKDCGIERDDDAQVALGKLDNHLCELKEMQIRDGLHVFGASPRGDQATDLLVALARLPRGDGRGENESLLRALASDLGLCISAQGNAEKRFDPLDTVLGEPWTGPRPPALEALLSERIIWRTHGDTVERLEVLAKRLVEGAATAPPEWPRTQRVLQFINERLRPQLTDCGDHELAGLLQGLAGRLVPPGPSGAPTRGRLEVLPTGRNFYGVDTRTVPTPAAWQLGWKSANLLLERYRQEQGDWPRQLALSAWGTSNMRTGGDDIAQALALLGVRPTWDTASNRVNGFEILPLDVLDRPRVDVTLRISGFFRDAFPYQVDLFDAAVRACAALKEAPELNPVAAEVDADTAAFMAEEGLDEAVARRRASYRVFGSKPGAYGAGLQALIDERGWETDADLARAYVAWGGHAYGGGTQGAAEHRLFERRLADVELVVQNQDNREHDILDSDDYYQFEGGLSAAVRHLSGRAPVSYHGDHSRPQSPRIRTLKEEVARVVRARVVNPKWIAGVMRHGYKGAFEMAATVDYLFAFAATARAVGDHHFDAVYDAFVDDETVQAFLAEHNPQAGRDIAARLLEAQDRELWRPKRNFAHEHLKGLAGSPSGDGETNL